MLGRALVITIAVALAACAGDGAQHEVTAPGDLLSADGTLREPGWSPEMLERWNPEAVADPSALRQWDFFSVTNGAAALNLTLLDLGYLQVATVGVVDLATGQTTTSMRIKSASDAFALSSAVEGDAALGSALAFTTDADTTQIAIDVPASSFGPAAQGAMTIHRRPAMPYLSLATPFDDDPHHFFYEQKIPGMTAAGQVTVGTAAYTFSADDTIAVMDWGRGAWPAMVTWRWAAASGVVGGETVSFNLGEGFGDPRAGTENLAVVADAPAKLATVAWTVPDDPSADWRFDAPDGRAALVLHPVAPEVDGLDLGSVYSHLHKAYGTFTGTITLDDGRVVTVDGLRGFAERDDISW